MTSTSLASASTEAENGKISLEALSKMTGFPVELIQTEIFSGRSGNDEISLEELRSAMLSYIDSTMMLVNDDK